MNDRMALATARAIRRAIAVTAMLVLGVFLNTGAFAQTLTDPAPPAKWTPPRAVAKSRPAAAQKSCGNYGAGFVKVPGTEACVKVGGWVTVEGSAGR